MNVHFALLALLANGPRSGLRLREELAAGPSGMHPPNARQVYPALARLERAGLVESSGAAGRTIRSRSSGSPPAGSGSSPDGCARRRLQVPSPAMTWC